MDTAEELGLPLAKPIQGFQPSTFLERGIAVPFTTPALVGARLRPAERRGLELIVPNPAGGRGVYIVPWDGVQDLCSPTLHDRQLNARLDLLSVVTPGGLRRMACEVAAEGLAGRDAVAPARALLKQTEQDQLFATFELLLAVVRAVEQRDAGWLPPNIAERDALERRAQQALATMAPRVGRPAEDLMGILEELAVVFTGVGIGRQAAEARLPLMIAQLDALRRQMRLWQRACGEGGSPDAMLVDRTAELTASLARATLQDARGLLADLPRLFRAWANAPDDIVRLCARPEWLLDGWERICLLWQTADDGFGRPATLNEMVALIPTTPREASAWVEMDLEARLGGLRHHRRKVASGEDWRTGVTVVDLIARNEKLRALSPAGPA